MGFEQVFDNLTFKHIDALRKQIQSLVDTVLLDKLTQGHNFKTKLKILPSAAVSSAYH